MAIENARQRAVAKENVRRFRAALNEYDELDKAMPSHPAVKAAQTASLRDKITEIEMEIKEYEDRRNAEQ